MPDDPRALARNLVGSEPFMVIPRAVANVGQTAANAWDTAKGLAAQASPAITNAQQAIQRQLLALMQSRGK
jgi:hypothetical protein